MKVNEIMSRDVIFAAPECPIDQAIRLFEGHTFRHLPVVDENRLVGMVSDRDIALSTGWVLASHRNASDTGGPQLVEEIMNRDIRSLGEEDEVKKAAGLFLDERIGAMPIVREGEVVGIVTTTDLMRACREADLRYDWKIRPDAVVSDWMSPEVRTVSPDSSVFDALDLCKDGSVRHLPVVEGNKLVGMISDRDLRFGLGQEIVSDQVAQDEGRLEVSQTPISALMTTEVITIRKGDLLSAAADSLLKHGFSALPVQERGRLAGIITHTDILRSCC